MAKHWTQDELTEIVNMHDGGREWKEIAEHFNVKKENAVAAYRRAVGAKTSGYAKAAEERASTSDTYEEGDNFINIVCSSPRVMSKEDIIKQFNIDLNVWEIERFRIRTSEGYRKDRSVEWHVKDGSVVNGDVSDSGKMLVVPLYHVEVKLIRKETEIKARSVFEGLLEDAKKFTPKYEPIIHPKYEDGCLFEPDIFDVHFGRETWWEESGESYDVKIAERAVKSVVQKLIYDVIGQKVARIVLPLGNDFFNVDNKFNTTTKGTPQQEDTRWQKTFRKGCNLVIWMIDMFSQIAPVDVLMIPGNHDEERNFYMGVALEYWYHNNVNVHIDNKAAKQKYYSFGKNLIGFAHGADEKLERLPLMMAVDRPDLWVLSKYREWHTGDKHQKKDLIPIADESTGMTIRILRSLASQDAWTFNNGYRSVRSAEAFLWHPENGLIAQYTAIPDME